MNFEWSDRGRGIIVSGDTWTAGLWINRSDGRWKVRSLLLPWFAFKRNIRRGWITHPRFQCPSYRTRQETRVWLPWVFFMLGQNKHDHLFRERPKTVPTFKPKNEP